MRICVFDHHEGDRRRDFEGDEEELRRVVLHHYPWLVAKMGAHAPLEVLVAALNRAQAHSAVVLPDGEADLVLKDFGKAEGPSPTVAAMLGHDARLEACLAAARFLAGADAEADPLAVRRALWEADGDPEAAALRAYGLTPDYRETLKTVVALDKAEPEAPPQVSDVVPATDAGSAFAEAVQRAFKGGGVQVVHLGGKHSAGSLVAKDPDHHVSYLLKPGAGPQNPAAGLGEEVASQSKREAASWDLAQAWGLGAALPEAHLLLLDGREYAAMKLLGRDYQDMNHLRVTDPALPRRLFHLYLHSGALHQWGVLDYVLGNADRNAGNVMARGEEVKLIDQGSAWAGQAFAPATDRYTFVPYYLRAFAGEDFPQLPPERKYQALPRASGRAADLARWLEGLDPAAITTAAHRYGLDPSAAVARLQHLKQAAKDVPADLAVNAAWTLP